jgi:threonine/homoserine/homoserine lactone efflux protein
MAIETEALFGLLTILAVGLFTPGPNNITAISHSAVHGARSNISLITGMAIGFIIVHMIVGITVNSIDSDSVFFSLFSLASLFFAFRLNVLLWRKIFEK